MSYFDLTIIIPTFNCEKYLQENIKEILETTSLKLQIIIVDDHSTDNTFRIIQQLSNEHSFIEGYQLERNSGAGIARNFGIKYIKGNFTLFFDADDKIVPGSLDHLLRIASENNPDVIVSSYYTSSKDNDLNRDLNPYDERIFTKILKEKSGRILTQKEIYELIKITNFPWNKIIKSSFISQNQIIFGSTKVQNDVLGHWMILTLAKSIYLSEQKICTHYIIPGTSAITNISDERRLQTIDALIETRNFLASRGFFNSEIYGIFFNFSIDVIRWAIQKMIPELRMILITNSKHYIRHCIKLNWYKPLFWTQVNKSNFKFLFTLFIRMK